MDYNLFSLGNILKTYTDKEKGIKSYIYRDFLINHGYLSKFCGFKLKTVERLNLLDKTKKYILLSKNHVFTCINGILSEKIHGRTIIYRIFEKSFA